MAQVKTKGLVIREQPFQEQDKILTIFTEQEGKQKAIAKGVRRSKGGALIAATQLFAFSEFVYYQGKNFAVINQANLVEAFYPLRQNLDKMTLSSCVLELLDAFFDFYQGQPTILKLANHILYYLSDNQAKNDRALVAAFQLKMAEAQGIRPVLGACAQCGRQDDLSFFDIESGGAVCKHCVGTTGYRYRLLPDQLVTMQTLMARPIKEIKTMDFTDEIILKIMDVMDHYISYNLDRKLNAYAFYKTIKGDV